MDLIDACRGDVDVEREIERVLSGIAPVRLDVLLGRSGGRDGGVSDVEVAGGGFSLLGEVLRTAGIASIRSIVLGLHGIGAKLLPGEASNLAGNLAGRNLLPNLQVMREIGCDVTRASFYRGGDADRSVFQIALMRDSHQIIPWMAALPEVRQQEGLDQPVPVSTLLAAAARARMEDRPCPSPGGIEVMEGARRPLAKLRLSRLTPGEVFPHVRNLNEMRMLVKLYGDSSVLENLAHFPPGLAAKAVDLIVDR